MLLLLLLTEVSWLANVRSALLHDALPTAQLQCSSRVGRLTLARGVTALG